MSDDAPVTNALRLADHEILREIGRGGMGVVYLARQRVLDRLEVLKVMNESFVRDGEAAERFLREIRSAASLHHPNIVTAYSAVLADRTLAFAMEYVQGIDLAKLVAARGPLSVGEACYFVRDAALGLQHAMEAGMVHRDIKPSNLLLSTRGGRATVKILDFGLAKAARECANASGLTYAGQFLGTPEYMAPEQARNAAAADIRCDIYSLGCTLFFLLTGTPPFRGNVMEVLMSHEHTQPQSVHLLRGDVPNEVDAIVQRMLDKHPEERYSKPVEIAEALGSFAIAPQLSELNRIADEMIGASASAKDTRPIAKEATLVGKSGVRAGLMEADAPWVVKWFPAYCLFVAGICLCMLLLFPLGAYAEMNAASLDMTPLTEQQRRETLLGAIIVCTPALIGLVLFTSGLFLRRRPSTWSLGLVLLVGGICFAIPCPLSIAMAYFWLQDDARGYFFADLKSSRDGRQF